LASFKLTHDPSMQQRCEDNLFRPAQVFNARIIRGVPVLLRRKQKPRSDCSEQDQCACQHIAMQPKNLNRDHRRNNKASTP
jgi:hypothetical protein